MRQSGFVALVGASLFATALAMPPAHSEGVTLEGAVDCGMWVEARRRDTGEILEGFAIGMLNGLSYGRQREFWDQEEGRTSRESVFLWVDNFCSTRPFAGLSTALILLFFERSPE